MMRKFLCQGKYLKRYNEYTKRFEEYNIQRSRSKLIRDLIKEKGIEYILDHALELPKFTVDKEGLKDVLLQERERRNQSRWSTSYAKLAVVYDWMHFMNEGINRKS